MRKSIAGSNVLIVLCSFALAGCNAWNWEDAYPNNPHTTATDEHKNGASGFYGGTNTKSGNPASNEPLQSNSNGNLPGSGTSDAAGSGVTNNSLNNFSGNSSETTGSGLNGTTSYSGSSAAGSTAGQTNNNATNGGVSPGSR